MKTKSIAMTGTAVLLVLLGISVPGYAGQEHQGEKQDQAKPQPNSHEQAGTAQQQHAQPQQARPQQGQNKPQAGTGQQPNRERQQQGAQQARAPEQRQAQERPQQHSQEARGNEHSQRAPEQRQAQEKPQQRSQEARSNEHSQRAPEQQHLQQSAWQQHRSGNWQSDHRTWQQRGGYNGYRIPEDRFRGYFGQGHGFRIAGLPFLVVGGYPRFQYDGYWFSMVDPYPGNWAANWYDTDDVYVGYVNNGYYLYNRRYPGVGLAISVSM
jgi:hypothetical protein